MGTELETLEDDPKTKKKKRHRLSDMVTHEVSVVDNAANKRRFIVIKSDDGTEIQEVEEEVDDVGKQVKTKTEDGKAFPAGAFAFVPDATKPSTWKLKLFDNPADVPDKPSVRLTAAAAAALGSGFRGQKVQLPAGAKAGVKNKVRAAWFKARRQAGQEVSNEDLPAVLKKENDMGADAAVEELETEAEITTKRIVAARIDEAIARVQAIKGVVETAKVAETSENTLPLAIGRELRGTQFLLKGIAGVTKGVSFLVPGSESMAEVTEIEAAVQKGTTETLDEVERRLEALKSDLGEAEKLSPGQARKIDDTADMIGSVVADYPTTKGLAITSASLDDGQRTEVLASLEKTMNDLGAIYLSLQTDSVAKKSSVADEFEVGAVIHDAAAILETGVAKMLEGREGGAADINSLVETARTIAKALGEESSAALEPVHGVFVDLRKAAQMFEVRGGWDGKAKVVLASADEVVSEFDDRLAAEADALRRNIEMVTKTAKTAEIKKGFSSRKGGPKGYQVVDGSGDVVADVATATEASAEASRRNLTSKQDNDEEDDVAGTETETGKAGRPMQGARLNRLKSAAATLGDALSDLQSGSASMEKFKKAAQELADVIREVQTVKAALANRGMTDDRGTSEDAPNQGSGIQPDTDAVGGIDDIAGSGTPDLTDVLKQVKELKAAMETEATITEATIAKRDTKIAKLEKRLKRKAAPSTRPVDADDEETEIRKRGGSDDNDNVSWPTDLNSEDWDDEDEYDG